MNKSTSRLKPLSKEDANKQTIGRYEIVKIIGYGGMGVVYLAFDSSMKRTLAH